MTLLIMIIHGSILLFTTSVKTCRCFQFLEENVSVHFEQRQAESKCYTISIYIVLMMFLIWASNHNDCGSVSIHQGLSSSLPTHLIVSSIRDVPLQQYCHVHRC